MGEGPAVVLAEGKTYRAAWWNPTNGRDGKFRPAGAVKAGDQSFTPPAKGDWALRILATQ